MTSILLAAILAATAAPQSDCKLGNCANVREPNISVFAKFIRNVARERKVSLAKSKDRIAYVHLKDQSKTENRTYVTLGLGGVPNEQVVRQTCDWGYDGWYTLENPVGDTYLDTVRQIAVLKVWLSGK